MKTSTTSQPTNKDMFKAFTYILAIFAVTVLLLAGADLIDQITLWLK